MTVTYTLSEYCMLLLDRLKCGSITASEIDERLKHTQLVVQDGDPEATLRRLEAKGLIVKNSKGRYTLPKSNYRSVHDPYRITRLLVRVMYLSDTLTCKFRLLILMRQYGYKNPTDLPKPFYDLLHAGKIFEVKRVVEGRAQHMFGLSGIEYTRYDLG